MGQKIRVAINGFGRIGRLTFRKLLQNENVEIVAINDLANAETLVHLLAYDSVHGKMEPKPELREGRLCVFGHQVKIFSERDPEALPWLALNVDILIESTGQFTSKEGASKHLKAGAAKVVISAPAKDQIKTIVIGVNEGDIEASDVILSNASCTTNCLAPLVKVLHSTLGIERGYISTVHAYTADQRIQDAPHKDLRRARAAAMSIIPTSTGAASAVSKVLPEMEGKLDGIALRVPVPDGSLVDFTAVLKRNTSVEEVNHFFQKAAAEQMNGIMEYSSEPLVSVDILGNSHSCIIDSKLTAVNENIVKVIAWYDNEYGYSCRTADLVELMVKR